MFNFKSLNQLLSHFSDERVCWDYLEKQLWDGKPVCPHCGCTSVYRLANYKQFKCGNKATCDRKFTVTVGTVYENTKMPLSTWFAAIYLSTSHKKGISSCQLARDLGITQRSAWFLLHRVREMVKKATNIPLVNRVQVDETYIKGKAHNRTKRKRELISEGWIKDEPSVVLGMVDKNNAVLRVVPSSEMENINPVINEVINEKGATLVTDGYVGYNSIGLTFGSHIVLNHSKGEFVKADFHTNSVEGVFSLFDRTVYGTYHNVSPKHLQRYCTLFAYRFNSRPLREDQRFDMTIKNSKARLKYADLIRNS